MHQMLKATLRDVPLLDGYLHDASFVPNDLEFDADAKTLRLPLDRICYEKAERRKVLLVFPVICFPGVECLLTITNVRDVVQNWKRGKPQDPDDLHTLLDLVHENHVLELRSDALVIRVTVSPDTGILLQDTSGSSTRTVVTDFAATVFRGMDEIEKLRVRADA